ncbi:MAG: hypothetical protein GY926_09210, partial [bacterium]|nr:hypothetical protein [bacterium]
YELREWTPSFERDVGTVRFEYVPCEGMFFSADLSWLIFASHESVVTLGGSIVTELRRSWDELNEHIWDGHF